jgi:transposase
MFSADSNRTNKGLTFNGKESSYNTVFIAFCCCDFVSICASWNYLRRNIPVTNVKELSSAFDKYKLCRILYCTIGRRMKKRRGRKKGREIN